MASRVLALVEHPANELLPLEDDERAEAVPAASTAVAKHSVPGQLPLQEGVPTSA
jgi:hypothetical protein